jgi:hypothetical protein
MTFPSDIKQAMRECILKLLWPKDDIVAFFEGNSCTKADIKAVGVHKTMHRYAIVDAMFEHLSKSIRPANPSSVHRIKLASCTRLEDRGDDGTVFKRWPASPA